MVSDDCPWDRFSRELGRASEGKGNRLAYCRARQALVTCLRRCGDPHVDDIDDEGSLICTGYATVWRRGKDAR